MGDHDQKHAHISKGNVDLLYKMANSYADFFDDIKSITQELIREAEAEVEAADKAGTATDPSLKEKVRIARTLTTAMQKMISTFPGDAT